ncbi:hypothetical protein [Mucilaginibacter ginsenosidivorax]|uniref:Protochlamydia outer membrane protein domain-containing protein n=1 Tax=Mucilaginibacter ginsenosidivorax TaxID=862126 RepID=A0A5B8W2Q6_9SPHI|nr:hypothetical protein [Mucilaginibacter ginsenosidivorax]QEC76598.1 hypothetical protein FSB76_11795 [Mucilaginibacter ginsenosidivorax]
MKKFASFYFILIITACLVHAQQLEKKLQVDAGIGYQQENFRWSISGNISGQNPNVLSELKWMKVGGQNAAAFISYNFWKRFVAYGDYSRHFISSGTVNDSDYGADNRNNNTYNETFNANKGNTSLWNLGVGYVIFNNHRFSLIPYIGYGESTEFLHLLDRGGMFPGLNSSYAPKWKGGFLKVVSSVMIAPHLKFKADVTYHQVSYNGNGNWNLITSFQHPVSYRHHANGYGIEAGGKLSYDITNHFAIQIGGGCFTWQTGNGTDQLYLNNGQIDKTQLNGVSRIGFGVSGGVNLGW